MQITDHSSGPGPDREEPWRAPPPRLDLLAEASVVILPPTYRNSLPFGWAAETGGGRTDGRTDNGQIGTFSTGCPRAHLASRQGWAARENHIMGYMAGAMGAQSRDDTVVSPPDSHGRPTEDNPTQPDPTLPMPCVECNRILSRAELNRTGPPKGPPGGGDWDRDAPFFSSFEGDAPVRRDHHRRPAQPPPQPAVAVARRGRR
ncbi:hypothetical protein GGR56DRAFT_509275 [Xylariaceae sp. FL0804]|nr:hypothetical protein GGR56DRAFT_509275 [Xylariaceae sp. FL0804]